MTTDQKRLQIIKKVCNSDTRGINKIYEFMTGNYDAAQGLTPKDIEKAFSCITEEMFGDDFLINAVFVFFYQKLIEYLFGEE